MRLSIKFSITTRTAIYDLTINRFGVHIEKFTKLSTGCYMPASK